MLAGTSRVCWQNCEARSAGECELERKSNMWACCMLYIRGWHHGAAALPAVILLNSCVPAVAAAAAAAEL
jgi:hypothetical protein